MKVSQKKFLSSLCESNPNAVIIGSIGTISYDLNNVPHPHKILVRGAMGHVMGIGVGYALGAPDTEVIVVIGDGSFLMKMGSASTVLGENLKNLRVIVLNNNSYASCGGQGTHFEAIQKYVPFETLSCEPNS